MRRHPQEAEVKVIPETRPTKKPSQGEIIAVGPGGRDESGKLVDKTIGVKRIYLLNRVNGHIDSDQLLVHKLRREGEQPLFGLPEFDQPRWLWGYPNLEATATATSGLIAPGAILGSVRLGKGKTAVIYVSKVLNGDPSFPSGKICPKSRRSRSPT